MMKTWVEIICDTCGEAEHFRPPKASEKAMDYGWIIAGKKCFCSKKCRDNFKKP